MKGDVWLQQQRDLCVKPVYEVDLDPFSQPVIRFVPIRFLCSSTMGRLQISQFSTRILDLLHRKCIRVGSLVLRSLLYIIYEESGAVVRSLSRLLRHDPADDGDWH